MPQELRGLRHSDQTRGDYASAIALYIIHVNLRTVHTQAHCLPQKEGGTQEGLRRSEGKGGGAWPRGWRAFE